jgi:RNA polymerase sigma factor (sigma-70 family)
VTRDPDLLAAAFSQARPRLVRVAYAIIGSHSEAEDVVADCWFRLVAADKDEPVRDVEAWAVVAVSRMALDVLRSARVRRERYVGPWLPEPVIAAPDEAAADPADKVTLADEVGYAILVVMETLSPAERTAFVLHDLFGVSFDEVAAIVGRAPAAVRQLASRARRHVRGQSPWPSTGAAEHRRVVEAFAAAATSGDLAALIRAGVRRLPPGRTRHGRVRDRGRGAGNPTRPSAGTRQIAPTGQVKPPFVRKIKIIQQNGPWFQCSHHGLPRLLAARAGWSGWGSMNCGAPTWPGRSSWPDPAFA